MNHTATTPDSDDTKLPRATPSPTRGALGWTPTVGRSRPPPPSQLLNELRLERLRSHHDAPVGDRGISGFAAGNRLGRVLRLLTDTMQPTPRRPG